MSTGQPFLLIATIIDGQEVWDAWQWLVAHINPRPTQPQGICIYDHKFWIYQSITGPLIPDDDTTEKLGILYLTSQLINRRDVLNMVKGDIPSNVTAMTTLDENIKKVIRSEKRFRHALSEHLAFWVQLANTAKSHGYSNFACTRPNIQPEDKGPDGLFMQVGQTKKVEVQSVKSSILNPASLISSAQFRKNKKPNHKKQLDGFYLQAHKNLGLTRLDDLLADVCDLLNLSATQHMRMALLSTCSYNAIVVADDAHADEKLFEGYQHITPDESRCVATYIGSTNWSSVAEKTREFVMKTLEQSGVW